MTIAITGKRPRQLAGTGQLPSDYDGHGTSMEIGGGMRVPYAVEQDEDGFWCAHVRIRDGVAAFGDGTTREAALDDLRKGLDLLLSVIGPCP